MGILRRDDKAEPGEIPGEETTERVAASGPGATSATPGATGAARPSATPAAGPGVTAARPAATAAAKPSERELSERLDGMRGWLGDLDNTVSARSRIGLVLAAIAIGAAGAAIYLSLDARSQSASNTDVGALREQLKGVQDDLESTGQDVTSLRGSVNAARSQAGSANATAASLRSQIKRLRADVKDLQQSASAAPVTQLPGVPPTTGTGTTTTPSGGGPSGGAGTGGGGGGGSP